MPRTTPRLWLPLVGLGCLLTANAAPAAGPFKIDSNIEWHFDVKFGPQAEVPRAPWYTYFPVDPNLAVLARGTPFPGWPNPFPPAVNVPSAAPSTPAPPPFPPPPTPNPNGAARQTSWGWAMTAPAAGVQPVGYVPAQVPSYWYGR